MGQPYVVGDRVVHMTPAVLFGPLAPDPQVMSASEGVLAFARRVNEMAGLAEAMRKCQDGTAFTAMRTRADAIDD